MRNVLFFIPLCLTLFLTGCATSANYQKMLQTWHGKNINEFINVWGYPNRTMKAPNDNTVYVYQYKRINHFPGYRTPTYTAVKTHGGQTSITQYGGQYIPGNTYRYQCTTWVEFDKQKTIVRTLFRGNDCTA